MNLDIKECSQIKFQGEQAVCNLNTLKIHKEIKSNEGERAETTQCKQELQT